MTGYQRLEDFKTTLPKKPKAGLYIDDLNLYKRGKASGWMTDYKKLYNWVAQMNTIVHARIYIWANHGMNQLKA